MSLSAHITQKLDDLRERHEELSALLCDAEVMKDLERMKRLSREYSELDKVAQCFGNYQHVAEELDDALALTATELDA